MGVSDEHWSRIDRPEPVWAIGQADGYPDRRSKRTPGLGLAGAARAKTLPMTRILYGGSVKPAAR